MKRSGPPPHNITAANLFSVAMYFYWLILGVLCVWRITHLLNAEDGPGEVLVRFRRRLGNGFFGQLLDCFYCLSLWIALPLAWYLGDRWKQRLLLWPALSAGAILLERATSAQNRNPGLEFYEDPDSKTNSEKVNTADRR